MHLHFVLALSLFNSLPNMASNQCCTQEQVETAVKLVKSKQMSLNGASKAFGIPYATLGDHMQKTHATCSQNGAIGRMRRKSSCCLLKVAQTTAATLCITAKIYDSGWKPWICTAHSMATPHKTLPIHTTVSRK